MADQDALNNAAALMLLLGDAEAGAVMRQLSGGQALALKQAIARIDPAHRILGPRAPAAPTAGATSTRRVVEVDVAIDMPGDVSVDVPVNEPAGAGGASRLLSDSSQYVRSLLQQAFGAAFHGTSQASSQASQASGGASPARSAIRGVRQADLATVAHLLVAEHPQVAAALLAWLDRDIAAQVLPLVPPRVRGDLVARLAHLGPVRPDTAAALDTALAGLLGDLSLRRSGPQGGIAAAADLLHRLGPQRHSALLDTVRAQDADLAQRIQDRLAEPADGPISKPWPSHA